MFSFIGKKSQTIVWLPTTTVWFLQDIFFYFLNSLVIGNQKLINLKISEKIEVKMGMMEIVQLAWFYKIEFVIYDFLYFVFYSSLEDISEMSKIPREGKNASHSDLTFIEILVDIFATLNNIKSSEKNYSN